MGEHGGYVDVERTIGSIVIGARHRTDLGDLEPLMASIQRVGLLQPITITPDGVLICGRRRLEAVRRLGWRTLRVWVRTGLSDSLTQLLAQQDENAMHKPLSPIEAAALYRELKQVLAEDAARRQEATRFGAAEDSEGVNGAADSAGPPRGQGDARRQAANHITQSSSYNRLEQVGWLEKVAATQDQPPRIRELAARELERIRQGGAVDPSYQRVRAATELLAAARNGSHRQEGNGAALPSAEEMEAVAAEALARAKEERARRSAENAAKRASRAASRPLRYFVLTWRDLDGWSNSYDAQEVGRELDAADWETFERVLAETNVFAEAAREARHLAAVGS